MVLGLILHRLGLTVGNEYFDYNLDRPGMVATIQSEVRERDRLERLARDGELDPTKAESSHDKLSEKMMGSTTRIIHDGTFPPYTALLLATFVQGALVTLMYASRNTLQFTSTRAGLGDTPFRGMALVIGLVCTVLSQGYVGPPLRLHYRGFGELVSALLLSPVSFLFGLMGHYSATHASSITLYDLLSPLAAPDPAHPSTASPEARFAIDKQVWTLFASFYCFEQARILIMHIHDIDVDRAGGKNTFCVQVGAAIASRLYLVLNALCGVFTYLVFRQLKAHEGMVLRVAGSDVDAATAGYVGVGWKIGAIVVGCYALPVTLVTAKSLFAALNATTSTSANGKATHGTDAVESVDPVDRTIYNLFPSFIPVTSSGNLAKMVSLMTLVTPAVLSLTLTGTVLAVGNPVIGVKSI